MTPPPDISGIILAGGQGTRLQSVRANCPKPLIPCAGRPFLEWVLQWYRRQGIREFVVSLGHLAEVAERYLASRLADDLRISTVIETSPLGTAGAIRLAWSSHPGRPVLIANGDSILLADLQPLWSLWETTAADAIVVGIPQADAARYGTLTFDEHCKLLGFAEKWPGQGVINAGIYLFGPELFELIPKQTPLSLERDVFPELLQAGRDLRVCVLDGPFLDIGLPETLAQADSFLRTQWIEDLQP